MKTWHAERSTEQLRGRAAKEVQMETTTIEMQVKSITVRWGKKKVVAVATLTGRVAKEIGRWESARGRGAIRSITVDDGQGRGAQAPWQNPPTTLKADGELAVQLRLDWPSRINARTPAGAEEEAATLAATIQNDL